MYTYGNNRVPCVPLISGEQEVTSDDCAGYNRNHPAYSEKCNMKFNTDKIKLHNACLPVVSVHT